MALKTMDRWLSMKAIIAFFLDRSNRRCGLYSLQNQANKSPTLKASRASMACGMTQRANVFMIRGTAS
jgi:hypothetical protein